MAVKKVINLIPTGILAELRLNHVRRSRNSRQMSFDVDVIVIFKGPNTDWS